MTHIRDLGRVALAAAGLLMLASTVAPAWAGSTERVRETGEKYTLAEAEP